MDLTGRNATRRPRWGDVCYVLSPCVPGFGLLDYFFGLLVCLLVLSLLVCWIIFLYIFVTFGPFRKVLLFSLVSKSKFCLCLAVGVVFGGLTLP